MNEEKLTTEAHVSRLEENLRKQEIARLSLLEKIEDLNKYINP
jgi:hypothetical protein